jgi:dynactin complex subunit
VDGYACEGVLRFFGMHKVKKVMRCGVEMDEPVGKNNGTIKGHQYFQCPEDHGVLVVPAKV